MLAVLLLSLGCPRSAPTEPAAEEPAEPAVEPIAVSVVEDPRADRWTVTWRFPEPVPGVVFPRDRHRFRAQGWTLQGEGVRWSESRHGEVLLADDAPVASITVQFDSDFRNRAKDYKLNLPFTDGGRLLYTGHLAVHPLVPTDDGLTWADGPAPHAWSVTTSPDRSVRVLDQAGQGHLSWREDDVDRSGGTYVYVGSVEPLAADDLIAVLDPGLPAWMRQLTLEALPALFAHFADRTGHPLGFRPLILVGSDPEGSGRTLKGGSLEGLLQLFAGGTGWSGETDEAREQWLWFLGHEAFHLWNSQRFERRGGRWEEWASEGLSDLYALRGLRELQIVDEASVQRSLVRAADRCLLGIGTTGLLQDPGSRPYGTEYACGSVLLHLLDVDLQRRTGGEVELDTILHRTWARAEASDGRWSTLDLLEEVQLATDDPIATRWLMDWLYGPLPQPPEAALAGALAGGGVPVRLGSLAEAELQPGDLHRATGALLSRCGCPGRLETREGRLAWIPGAGCPLNAAVFEVQGVPLDAGADALIAALDHIRDGGGFRLGAGLELTCEAEAAWSRLLVYTGP